MTTRNILLFIGTILYGGGGVLSFTVSPCHQQYPVKSFSTNHQRAHNVLQFHQPIKMISRKDLVENSMRSKPLLIGPLKVSFTSPENPQEDNAKNTMSDINDNIGIIGLVSWLVSLSSFVLVNNFVGPWPFELIDAVPEPRWLLIHYIGGMLFAGGIILTTCMEQLAVSTKDKSVLNFWFQRVPMLDCSIVLPGLTMAMVAGVCSTVHRYHSLAMAPVYIKTAFYTLAAFAAWWGLTDLSTQPKAAAALEEWAAAAEDGDSDGSIENENLPNVVHFRKISNVVSCGFVIALYAIMTLKPGALDL